MNSKFIKENPELYEKLNATCRNRCHEILDDLAKTNQEYSNLIKKRALQSTAVRNECVSDVIKFNNYMDLIVEQELIELDTVYIHAFIEAFEMCKTFNFSKSYR